MALSRFVFWFFFCIYIRLGIIMAPETLEVPLSMTAGRPLTGGAGGGDGGPDFSDCGNGQNLWVARTLLLLRQVMNEPCTFHAPPSILIDSPLHMNFAGDGNSSHRSLFKINEVILVIWIIFIWCWRFGLNLCIFALRRGRVRHLEVHYHERSSVWSMMATAVTPVLDLTNRVDRRNVYILATQTAYHLISRTEAIITLLFDAVCYRLLDWCPFLSLTAYVREYGCQGVSVSFIDVMHWCIIFMMSYSLYLHHGKSQCPFTLESFAYYCFWDCMKSKFSVQCVWRFSFCALGLSFRKVCCSSQNWSSSTRVFWVWCHRYSSTFRYESPSSIRA